MASLITSEFSRVRSFFWPIHRYELKKILPMALLFFLICFNYNILKNMKDALIITPKMSGAEVIPYIKVWAMLPTAILITFLFTRLSNIMTTEYVFYTMISFFLIYFAIFIFLIYPNREHLSLNYLSDFLQSILPAGFKGFIAMCRYWHLTSYYVIAEMWSNIILSVLFWGFANEITKIIEAKRFYAIFGLSANIATICAGHISLFVCRFNNSINPKDNLAWQQTIFILISIVIVCGILIMLIYRWMHKKVLTDPRYYDSKAATESANKVKMTMRENFARLFRSKYIFSIAFVVIAYNVIINLLEVIWKDHVRQLYPDPTDFTAYMNYIAIWTGIIAFIIAIFVTGNSLRRLGWAKTAFMTPIVLLITSVGFFGFMLYPNILVKITHSAIVYSPLVLVVFFGSVQNCLSRAAKFTVFDATKELAFIPLSRESKLKAKAAIDGVGSRFGKSGGSIIHQILLLIFGSLSNSAGCIAIILFSMLGGWLFMVKSLGKQFSELVSKQQEECLKQNIKDPFEETTMETSKKTILV